MGLDSKNEWQFQTSRRGLLKFLSGATLVGGAAAVAVPKDVPDPAEGLVRLAMANEIRETEETPQDYTLGSFQRNMRFYRQVVPWRLYDTHLIPNNLSLSLFFGHTLRTHPLSQTNMQLPNQLPAPNTFQIRRMWALVMGERGAAEVFASASSMELQIGHKICGQVSIIDICRYGLGEVGLTEESGPRCMDFTTMPLTIEAQQYFSVRMECSYTPSPLVVRCVLDGLMARAIQ